MLRLAPPSALASTRAARVATSAASALRLLPATCSVTATARARNYCQINAATCGSGAAPRTKIPFCCCSSSISISNSNSNSSSSCCCRSHRLCSRALATATEDESKNTGTTSGSGNLHQVKVPRMADSISEGILKSFTKAVGDYIREDEELASIETDKVDIPVNATVSGFIRALHAKPEDKVAVGALLCDIEPSANDPNASTKSAPSQQQQQQSIASTTTTVAEKPSFSDHGLSAPATAPATAVSVPRVAAGERREKLSPMRLRIAERLKLAQNTAASLTTFNEIDMSAVMAFRTANKDWVLESQGVKLGFMSAFIKAACYGWRHVPGVMARIDGEHVVHPGSIDISVAVATKKGLVTPVVRSADTMSFVQIEQEMARLAALARDGKLALADLAGGSFTISNGGVFGSLMGTPIINPPQSAVLGMHAVKMRPVVLPDNTIAARPMMYVCLTYDHRLIDGREAATFLVRVKEAIEDPARMLLI